MIKTLAGIKVVDQGTFITGPACGMLLGDLGADVIKVEPPGPAIRSAPSRRPLQPALSSLQPQQAQHRARHQERRRSRGVDALIADADVYIQNFRPGVAEKLGAGEKRLRAINPRLVYCSISGFGPTGPSANRPAYDTVAQAAGGFLGLLVNPENPRVVGPAIADSLTGFYAAYGVMGALFERGRTGAGRTVEVSMLEAMAHFNLDAFTHYFQADEVMGRTAGRASRSLYVLECSYGKWIARCTCRPPPKFAGRAR